MLGLAMPPQIDLTLKSSAAEFAGERLVTRVLSRVRDQIAALRERFAAHLTFVRFLTGMYISVLLHVALLVESLAAELARVRSRVRVD